MRKNSKFIPAAILILGFLGAAVEAAAQDFEWRPKIRLEFGGGWLSSRFGDLGLIADADDAAQSFRQDNRYTWMYSNNRILYWSLSGQGEGFPRLKNALPWDVRLRFQLPWDLVTFSVGFRSFSCGLEEKIPIEFERTVSDTESYIESLSYDPYRLTFNTYAVPLTLYYNMTEGMGVDASLFFALGPYYIDALYEKNWTEGFEKVINGVRSPTAPSVKRSLRMEGKGWGILVEGGLRFDFNLGRLFAIYVEAAYSTQNSFSIKGKGREVVGSTEENWEGKWMVRTDTLTADWGSATIDFIDSRPTAAPTVSDEKIFRLSSQGGAIRGGISIRF